MAKTHEKTDLATIREILDRRAAAPAREPVAAGRVLVNGREIVQASDPNSADEAVTGFCAGLDQSDTDNSVRLIGHFGRDLRVLAQAKAKSPLFVVWTGTHWDTAHGGQKAHALAQRLGDRILGEIIMLRASRSQQALIDAAKGLDERAPEDLSATDKATLKAAQEAIEALKGAKKKRRDFAISSKNKARIEAMLACAAPHVMTGPDEFNADTLRVAVRGHTLTFAEVEEDEVNPEAEREDAPADVSPTIRVKRWRMRADPGHSREDLITETIPVSFDPRARSPRWDAFLAEFMPRDDVRRMLQVSTGLGLLGKTVQKLFFHYGNGANGKSVFMEVICRVLGDSSVTLPADSFIGGPGQGGGATPDIARLHGRRFLRIQELPEGEDLREDLVKKVTGGEMIPVRDLFQGYFDFKPIFTGHMSGNGYPKITGTDNGIWRRMAVVLWPKTIPIEQQRDFEDVVSGFEPEHSGILNWLIEGALIYLREGLKIPESVTEETQKYRNEMDPLAGFESTCIEKDATGEVFARDLYAAYVSWAHSAAARPISETAFGRNMAKKYQREDGRLRRYVGIRLVNVPENPSGRGDYPEGYAG